MWGSERKSDVREKLQGTMVETLGLWSGDKGPIS